MNIETLRIKQTFFIKMDTDSSVSIFELPYAEVKKFLAIAKNLTVEHFARLLINDRKPNRVFHR